MNSSAPNVSSKQAYQNIVVMRHGERIDHVNPLWVTTAPRPWDPPLIDDGLIRAFGTANSLSSQLPFPFHRVFVSPFIRCIQTAFEAIYALSATELDPNAKSSKDVSSIDENKFKVSVELGLCEVLNEETIGVRSVPNFNFNISELEAMLPGLKDPVTNPVYKELPKYGETMECAGERYVDVFKALANKYPSENLLLVTHGWGVGTLFSRFKCQQAQNVEYCGYVGLRRSMSSGDDLASAGEFEVFVDSGVETEALGMVSL